uniref:hypothetical protein n=1 Tax=Paractinoplanes polyasparticus TaxID=2856853 RepID=UPI001C85E564|nr:hypothetical protein [Actinoplanes polyasparticus]
MLAALEKVGDWRHVHRTIAALRTRPGLFEPETLDLLTDILQANHDGVHRRYVAPHGDEYGNSYPGRPGVVAVPPGSRPAFREWARTYARAANVVADLTGEAVDEIGCLLVERSGEVASRPPAARRAT